MTLDPTAAAEQVEERVWLAETARQLGVEELDMTVWVAVDYFDFGGAVDVELPDEEQVTDLDEEELRQSLQTAAVMTPGRQI